NGAPRRKRSDVSERRRGGPCRVDSRPARRSGAHSGHGYARACVGDGAILLGSDRVGARTRLHARARRARGRMKFALRDDDTCCFTSPAALEQIYGDVWGHVPVCLATVPFAIGYERKGIPEEHWHSGEPFPLDRNAELVSALKELVASGRATVALHGYTHQDFANGYEFQAAPDPERRVRDGLRYLRETLRAPISVFVPPHNALSKRGLCAVADAGLNILGSFLSFRPSMRRWDRRTPLNWLRVRQFRRATGRTKRDRFVYPY